VPEPTDPGLEEELRLLGRQLEIPAGPDHRAAVRQRLAAEPARRRWPRWPAAPRWRLRHAAVLAAASLIAVFAVSPQVRASVANVLRFAGVEVQWGDRTRPLPSASPFRVPGTQVASLTEASTRAGFEVKAPEALGDPAEIYLLEPGGVTLVYREGAELPDPGPDGVSARLARLRRRRRRRGGVAGRAASGHVSRGGRHRAVGAAAAVELDADLAAAGGRLPAGGILRQRPGRRGRRVDPLMPAPRGSRPAEPLSAGDLRTLYIV
jgi:hypothetical protein